MSYSYVQHRKLQQLHRSRSNRAKRIDESLRAPMAKSAEQWVQQPNRFDVPDVDTPKRGAGTVSKREQDRRSEEIRLSENSRSRRSHRDFRQRLNMHKYSGVGR